jgi:multiple sugar transport system permease protein
MRKARGTLTRPGLLVAAPSYLLLGIGSVIACLPLYWGLITSLKTSSSLLSLPPSWIPLSPTWQNFTYVWENTSLPTNLLNSCYITVVTCAITLVLAFHAAYASTRLNFRGRGLALFILLMTIMVPAMVTLVPQYLLAAQFNLINTRQVLIIVFTAWQIPLAVWILRAHISRIPVEVEDAARVDGCSRLRAIYRIVLPLSWPGIAAATIIVFVWVWNEFIVAVTLTTSAAAQPVSAGLYQFVSETGVEWGRLSAGAMIALIPPLILFVILQRRFVEGLSAGSGK